MQLLFQLCIFWNSFINSYFERFQQDFCQVKVIILYWCKSTMVQVMQGIVSSGDMPLPLAVVTNLYIAIWRHWATMSYSQVLEFQTQRIWYDRSTSFWYKPSIQNISQCLAYRNSISSPKCPDDQWHFLVGLNIWLLGLLYTKLAHEMPCESNNPPNQNYVFII